MIPDNDPVWSCNVVLFLVISILMGDSAAIVQVLGKQKKNKKQLQLQTQQAAPVFRLLITFPSGSCSVHRDLALGLEG